MKICLVSSHGGHLHEVMSACKNVVGERYYVTYRTAHTAQLLKDESHYFVIDPHLTKWKYLLNGLQSLRHLIMERPKVIISTGAGIAIPTLLLGKWLFGAKIIYVESAANVVTPSKTAAFMYPYSDLFLVQWEEMLKVFPKAVFVGLL